MGVRAVAMLFDPTARVSLLVVPNMPDKAGRRGRGHWRSLVSNLEDPASQSDLIPPPPLSDVVAGGAPGPVSSPSSDRTNSSRIWIAVLGGFVSSVGLAVVAFSVMIFSAARDAPSEPTGIVSVLADFLLAFALSGFVSGAILVSVGVLILKRLRR